MENQILDAIDQTDHDGYAGFWLRFAAALVDGIIMTIVFIVITTITGLSFFEMLGGEMGTEEMTEEQMAAMTGGLGAIFLLSVLLPWLYFAVQESSANMATVGKKIIGIKVTDMHGQRLTFLNATGRHFGKMLSGLILYIGYIMAGFTEKKQALHDMMAGCLVVKSRPS